MAVVSTDSRIKLLTQYGYQLQFQYYDRSVGCGGATGAPSPAPANGR